MNSSDRSDRRVGITADPTHAFQEARSQPAAIGVDLGGTALRVGLLREDGELKDFSRAVHGPLSPDEAVERVIAALAPFPPSAPIGLGIAGALEGGVVRNAPNLGWRNVPLRTAFERRLQRKIEIVNDMCAIAWAERAARDHADRVLCVFVGTGLGSAVASEARVLDLELGHVIEETDGLRCGCGRRGCLEAYVAGIHLPSRLAAFGLPSEYGSPAHLDRAANRGEPGATALWDDIANRLARALAVAASALRPDALVLGGGVLEHAPMLCARVEKEIHMRMPRFSAASLRIESPRLGDRAGVVGAALLACRAFA